MKVKSILPSRKKATCCLSAVLLLLSTLSGCGSSSEVEHTSLQEAVQAVQSVEASISLELHGSFSGSGSAGPEAHTASLRSDGTITSTRTPTPAYHTEFYSSILVDGATTREGREIYVVPEDDEYIRYEYLEKSDEWQKTTVGQGDILAISRQTGFFYDWEEIMSGLTLIETQEISEEKTNLVYDGWVPTHVLQELFGNNVFGSFMYSVEQLLSDEIPCTLTVDGSTYLPEVMELDFIGDWTVSDMEFDTAHVTVTYSKWNQILEIEPEKKVSVGAIDAEEEFYSTYYAWNLFLPYLGGQLEESASAGNAGQIFASSWNTFQVRIDGGMTSVPLPFEDLQKIGYTIDDQASSLIMEPNKYKENVAVVKGTDKLYCTFYNDDTVPQPITNCKIGCIDISAANLPQNGIRLYLPGEVTLGITKDALLSAYGEASEVMTSFSCDTYTWKSEGDMQSFMAEISPITGQVIRIQIKNIPVTGGSQI